MAARDEPGAADTLPAEGFHSELHDPHPGSDQEEGEDKIDRWIEMLSLLVHYSLKFNEL